MKTEPVLSGRQALARTFWMMLGPALMLILAFRIFENGNGWLTITDLLYFVVLTCTIFARWFEFHQGGALNALGEPATDHEIRRYAMIATAIGLGVWVLCNLLGNNVWL